MRRAVIIENFFTSVISGNRADARQIVLDVANSGCSAEELIHRLFWPTLEQIQKLHRADQLSELAHHYATRIMRFLISQAQPRLAQGTRRNKSVLLTCGAEESEELAAQMVADLLEADGYTVYFAGGGIANDEIVSQLGELNVDVLVVFGAVPETVPMTRLLIDRLHEIGVCPKIQIVVGGGVFNRAEGLAEEIGADLWANSPEELIQTMAEQPEKRMTSEQRTVGRKRRNKRDAA